MMRRFRRRDGYGGPYQDRRYSIQGALPPGGRT